MRVEGLLQPRCCTVVAIRSAHAGSMTGHPASGSGARLATWHGMLDAKGSCP